MEDLTLRTGRVHPAADFLWMIQGIRDLFAAEPAAVSVVTADYGVIDRDGAARLLPLAERAVERRVNLATLERAV